MWWLVLRRAMDAARQQAEARYAAAAMPLACQEIEQKIGLISGANSALRQWMTGREFEWLQGQIALLLWHGGDDPAPFDHACFSAPHQSMFILTPSGARPNPKTLGITGFTYKEYREYRTGKKKIDTPIHGLTVGEYNILRDQNKISSDMPYVHQEYPKMVYKGSESKVVENAHEHQSARAAGYFNADEVFGK